MIGTRIVYWRLRKDSQFVSICPAYSFSGHQHRDNNAQNSANLPRNRMLFPCQRVLLGQLENCLIGSSDPGPNQQILYVGGLNRSAA